MEFRLLGRLEVEDAGADLTPARPKQRALLALLLLHEGEIVETDELIEQLWGEEPPRTALTALHGHVSALRKAVGSRIETSSGGYRLRLAPGDELDLRRVEALVARGRSGAPLDRSEDLGAALALFRGDPLSDLRLGGVPLPGEWTRLDELRLSILELKVEADLQLGLHRELIPELERQLADHPLRERLREQLMLALYRAGRQGDALHVAQAGRRALADELGIDPSPSLQRLEVQILGQDPALTAPQPHLQAPSARAGAIVTFLAADLAPLGHHGGGRRGSRADLEESLREPVARHRGTVLAEEPLVASFRRSADAADAALAIQAATRHLDARPRIGLDSGAATGRPIAVHEPGIRGAIHLRRAAHPGQTLVSEATRRLLEEAADRGLLEIVDLGPHALADLAPARHVYQLDDPRRPTRYPPILGLAARPTNLPTQPTPLIGREQELDEITALVLAVEPRLVTLTGPGGVGKTRLALHAGGELLDRFTHGVRVVDLAPLSDPSLVGPTVRHAVEVAGASAATPLSEEHDGELLLVVDNFEHLLPAAPVVAEVARAAPWVRWLVTSRAPLRVPGERVYEVGPLATPTASDDPELVSGSESVALFTDRARALRPEFTVDTSNARAVATLCTALDGLPLAIELAASRVAVLSPGKLAERLADRLEILDSGLRATSVRHGSLRATMAWSHDLLAVEERRLFGRLSVFAGGADLAAIEAVCGDGADVVKPLANLVDLSLVRTAGSVDEPRFAMLDTIRSFAAERLAADDANPEVLGRHARHFLALAEQAEPHLRGDPGAWLDRLEAEIDNLRSALDEFATLGDAKGELALAGAMWRFWYLRGYLTEGRVRLEASLARDPSPTPARGKALIGAAVMATNLGEVPAAIDRADEGMRLHASLGDRWGEAYCAFMLGNNVSSQGHVQRARDLFEGSIRTFLDLRDEHSALLATRSLAFSYEDSGDLPRAQALLGDALRLARGTHNPRLEASLLGALAGYAFDEGRLTDALWMLRESVRIHAEQGDHLDSAADLSRMARVLAITGHPGIALRLLASLSTLRPEIGGRRALVESITEETVARVRRQLDAATFSSEWQAGQSLTIAEALRLALEALPERRFASPQA